MKKVINAGLLAVVLLACVVSTAGAETLKVGDKAPKFDIIDIMGRIIRADDLKGWIVVYGFGDEGSAEDALKMLKNLTREEPDPKGVLFVCVADTSKHNSKVLRPFVKKLLKKEYNKEIKNVAQILEEKGIQTSTKLENRYILVADMGADIFEMFGISDTRSLAQGFLVDSTGTIRGHYLNEYSDQMAQDLRLAMTNREADQKFALKTKKKKRGTWKYYAAGAVVLWLVLKD